MLENPRKALQRLHGREPESEAGEDRGLPPVKTIHLDVEGEHGKRYVGDFVYRVPTIGQRVEIGQLKSQFLSNPSGAGLEAVSLVEIICYLTVTLDEKSLPDWWDPWNLYDPTPLTSLFKEVSDYEARFHGRKASSNRSGAAQEVDPEAGQDDGRGESQGDAAVGEEAQPPAQRQETLVSSRG